MMQALSCLARHLGLVKLQTGQAHAPAEQKAGGTPKKKKRVLFYRLCKRYRVWRGIYYLLSCQRGRHMRQQILAKGYAGGTPKKKKRVLFY